MRAIRAVLWDFGGVFTESPFKAFAAFERQRGLPDNFLRRVNSENPDANAWARFERGEITLAQFGDLFERGIAFSGSRDPRRGGHCTAVWRGAPANGGSAAPLQVTLHQCLPHQQREDRSKSRPADQRCEGQPGRARSWGCSTS